MTTPTCPLCHGDATVLGGLGRLTWYRCRCCGIDFSRVKRVRKPKEPK